MSDDLITIMIVDDHAILRRGLISLMEVTHGIKVIGEASNGDEAIKLAKSLNPDVILMDLVMPEIDGIEAIKAIKQHNPDARILVLTSFSDDEKVFPAIKAGAMGYLLKDCSTQELIKAINDINQGQSSLHPTITRKLMSEINQPSELKPTEEPLSGREVEVLKLVARGFSNKQVAEMLTVSDGTVRIHVSNILNKLHLASRTQATLYALREGLASLDSDE
jgi:two-component system, NarL family, response regulator LiaR